MALAEKYSKKKKMLTEHDEMDMGMMDNEDKEKMMSKKKMKKMHKGLAERG